MSKSKRKTSVASMIINIFLVVFLVFLVIMFIRGKMRQKEDGQEFYGGYNYEVLNNEVVLNEYLGSETEIEIPSEIEGMQVVSIAKDAFKNNEYVEKLIIPGSIRAIGISSFQGCINLKTVELQEGVEMICSYAFRNCKTLEKIDLPDTLTDIGYGAFLDIEGLTILCKEGSVGEEYALENEIDYKIQE